MSVYKRGNCWWYGFWFQGERIQKGTHQTNRRLAVQMEMAHRARLAMGEPEPQAEKPIPTFEEFSVQYLDFSKANKRCSGQEEVYFRSTLKPCFGKYRLDEITPLLVEQYKQKRLKDGLKKSSVNRALGLLKFALGKAVEWELVGTNGARKVKLFRLDDPAPDRVLSREEERKLLAACAAPDLMCRAPHLRAIILVALYTGLRRGEILGLKWTDVDFENGVLIVRQSKTASGRGRRVNLNSLLSEVLRELTKEAESEWLFPSPGRFQAEGKPLRHIADVKKAYSRAVKLASIPRITFHQLRHTFCSRLADAGVPLPVIQDLAGHASIIMTRRYTHPAAELKQKAVELLLAGSDVAEPATKPATPVREEAAQPGKSKGQVLAFKADRQGSLERGAS